MLSEKTFIRHGVIEEKDINYDHILRVWDIIEIEKETNPILAKNIENELKNVIHRNSNKKAIGLFLPMRASLNIRNQNQRNN